MEVICIAQFKAVSNKKNELVGALLALVPLTKKEAGCLQYDLCHELQHTVPHEDMWDVCLVERWKTLEDFKLHCDTTYIKNFFDVISVDLVDKSEIRLFKPQ